MAKKAIRPIRIEGNIAYVPLTKGYEAVIDAADVPLVEGFNWCALAAPYTVYGLRNGQKERGEERGRAVFLHHVICPPENGLLTDHRDGDGLNNRRANLRLASKAENGRNSRMKSRNTSGFKGVHLHKETGKWRARISTGDKHVSLGLFATPEDAHAAYAKASAELHGEFSRAS